MRWPAMLTLTVLSLTLAGCDQDSEGMGDCLQDDLQLKVSVPSLPPAARGFRLPDSPCLEHHLDFFAKPIHNVLPVVRSQTVTAAPRPLASPGSICLNTSPSAVSSPPRPVLSLVIPASKWHDGRHEDD